jgi:hypothetical protein
VLPSLASSFFSSPFFLRATTIESNQQQYTCIESSCNCQREQLLHKARGSILDLAPVFIFLCLNQLRSNMAALQFFVVLAILGMVMGFVPASVRTSSRIAKLSMADDYSALEKKLAEKAVSAKKVESTKAAPAKKVVTAAPKVTATPAKPVAAPVKSAFTAPAATVKAAPVKAAVPKKVVSVAPSAPSAISSGEFIEGVGLGLAPFLAIPLVLANGAKGLIKKPKPLPSESKTAKKVQVYNKPLGDGAKEGIDELLSGKVNEELELTRKGIKLSIGGFALAAAAAGALIASNGPKEAPKAPAATVKTEKKEAPKPVAKKVDTPKPTPKPAPAPAPKPVEKKVETPKPAPAPAPKPVEKKVEAPAPVPAPAPAPKPVEKVVEAPAPAPKPVEKKVEAPAPAPAAPVAPEDTAVVQAVPDKVPVGMEPDKVDLEALKALRVRYHYRDF